MWQAIRSSKLTEKKDIEVDIYVDADSGVLRMKRVGLTHQSKSEIVIKGVKDNGNTDWIPHFMFSAVTKPYAQRIKIARIDNVCYGQTLDITW